MEGTKFIFYKLLYILLAIYMHMKLVNRELTLLPDPPDYQYPTRYCLLNRQAFRPSQSSPGKMIQIYRSSDKEILDSDEILDIPDIGKTLEPPVIYFHNEFEGLQPTNKNIPIWNNQRKLLRKNNLGKLAGEDSCGLNLKIQIT